MTQAIFALLYSRLGSSKGAYKCFKDAYYLFFYNQRTSFIKL